MAAVKNIYAHSYGELFTKLGDWEFLTESVDLVELLSSMNDLATNLKLASSMAMQLGRAQRLQKHSKVITDNQFFLISRTNNEAAIASETQNPILLYTLGASGASWNTFVDSVDLYKAPLFLCILTTEGDVVGAFIPSGLTENGAKYFGDPSTFLFRIGHGVKILKTTGYAKNYVMLNRATPYVPKGIGFGGNETNFRLHIGDDLRTLTCCQACQSFESGMLLWNPENLFEASTHVSQLEVWGFGDADDREKQLYNRQTREEIRADRRKLDLSRFANDRLYMKPKAGERQEEVNAIIEEYRGEN